MSERTELGERSELGFFTSGGSGVYTPTHFAGSAWSEAMLNGPAVVAAFARELEREHGREGFQPARLTVDLMAPALFEDLVVSTSVVREGRRIVVVDATATQSTGVVARASFVQLRRGEEPPGRTWRDDRHPPAPGEDPAEAEPGARPWFGSDGDDGAPVWTRDMGPHQNARRKRFWQRPLPAVAGEDGTPFERAATLAESTSLMTNWGDEGIGYINADLTVGFARLPETADFGVEADRHLTSDGVAVGMATLYDRHGPFGGGMVVAVSNAKRQIDFGEGGRPANPETA